MFWLELCWICFVSELVLVNNSVWDLLFLWLLLLLFEDSEIEDFILRLGLGVSVFDSSTFTTGFDWIIFVFCVFSKHLTADISIDVSEGFSLISDSFLSN
jgi:hypothetical protein